MFSALYTTKFSLISTYFQIEKYFFLQNVKSKITFCIFNQKFVIFTYFFGFAV